MLTVASEGADQGTDVTQQSCAVLLGMLGAALPPALQLVLSGLKPAGKQGRCCCKQN